MLMMTHMAENQNPKSRLIEFISHLGIGQKKFEERCGLSNGYVNNSKGNFGASKLDDILRAFPQLNRIWLLTGEGEMLKSDVGTEMTAYEMPKFRTYFKEEREVMVPLIDIDSVGGIHSRNQIESSEQYLAGYVPFPDARPNDVAIMQSGDSMAPTIPAGAVLQIRQVEDWKEYFGYGNVYVLWLKDGRRITKLVKRYDEDPRHYIMCCSYNPEAADEELPRNFIEEVWKVVNVLVNKGW